MGKQTLLRTARDPFRVAANQQRSGWGPNNPVREVRIHPPPAGSLQTFGPSRRCRDRISGGAGNAAGPGGRRRAVHDRLVWVDSVSSIVIPRP